MLSVQITLITLGHELITYKFGNHFSGQSNEGEEGGGGGEDVQTMEKLKSKNKKYSNMRTKFIKFYFNSDNLIFNTFLVFFYGIAYIYISLNSICTQQLYFNTSDIAANPHHFDLCGTLIMQCAIKAGTSSFLTKFISPKRNTLKLPREGTDSRLQILGDKVAFAPQSKVMRSQINFFDTFLMKLMIGCFIVYESTYFRKVTRYFLCYSGYLMFEKYFVFRN